MDFNKNIPIYIQVMDYIKLCIINDEFDFNDKLPSTRKLAENLGLNTNTIYRAYYNLKLENIVYTKRGKGYFVTPDKEIIDILKIDKTNNITKFFICGMKSLNFSPNEIIQLTRHELNK